MRWKNKKGSVLITLIIALVLMAVLGAGIYGITTSSSFSELLSNRNDNAYQLAKAGIRYAVETGGTAVGDFLMPDNSKKFNLAKNGDEVTSTGIVNEGTFLEARRVLKYTLAGSEQPVIPVLPTESTINGTPGAITVDGNTITLGGDNVGQSYGSVWYNGNKTNGNCIAGVCSFGLGLRAYFEFSVPAGTGDGFTFAIISAINNTIDRAGGFSKAEYPGENYVRSDGSRVSVAGGELEGYAGPGNTRTMTIGPGEGLRPPKMALEFDTYQSATNYTPVYLAGVRNDPSYSGTSNNHVALMFWGADLAGQNTAALTYYLGGTHTYPLSSFDDNRHGAGTADRMNGAGSIGYFMTDGVLRSFRMEIARSTNPESSGTYAGKYKYTIKAWIAAMSALSTIGKSRFQDVIVPFTDTSPAVLVNQSAYFTATEHLDFEKIFWGLTQGTGNAIQKILITNPIVFFTNTATTCGYAISPSNAAYTLASASGSVALTTTNDCYWMVESLAEWITITPTYGKGSGTINYTVAVSTSDRTGYINISGQTFTITQTAPCIFSLNPTSNYVNDRGPGTRTISVNSCGLSWTAHSNNTSWLTISPASGTNGTITYNYTRMDNADGYPSGSTRTGTIDVTSGGTTLTFTLQQYRP